MSVGPYEQSLRDRAIAARRNLVGKVSVDVIQRLAEIAAEPRRKPSVHETVKPRLVLSMIDVTSPPSSAEIIKQVSLKHHVSVPEILSAMRSIGIVAARFEAIYRIREERHLSWAQIGRQFNRDHTSVLHGYRQHKKRLEAEL